MVWCDRCDVMVLSKKRYFVREMEKYGKVQRYMQQSEVSEYWEQERGSKKGSSWCVAWSSLYRAKHVTRSEQIGRAHV